MRRIKGSQDKQTPSSLGKTDSPLRSWDKGVEFEAMEKLEAEAGALPAPSDYALKEDKLSEVESNAQELQDLEDEMAKRVRTLPSANSEIQAVPTPPPTYQYHVCVVASIKGDNIFSDALVNVPKTVESAEDINALRSAMAQQLGALPERVTIVTFQYVTAIHA